MRIDFYHLLRTPLDQAVPFLTERVAALGKRLLICTALPERAAHLDALLWTYKPDSWLAHGVSGEGAEADQPVLISTDGKNLNNAEYILLTDGGTLDEILPFERCLNLFDGHDEAALQTSRALWKDALAAGCEIRYWAQEESGKWVIKASKNTGGG